MASGISVHVAVSITAGFELVESGPVGDLVIVLLRCLHCKDGVEAHVEVTPTTQRGRGYPRRTRRRKKGGQRLRRHHQKHLLTLAVQILQSI